VTGPPTEHARIIERGYVRYTGERTGQLGAIATLTRQTMTHAMGIRRTAWNKVMPFFAVILAYLPAIAFVGAAALAKQQRGRFRTQALLPSYAEYYGFVWAAILVFVAFVAPQVLCGDRRNGMLGLYLASPLTRTTYLAGKAAGVFAILGLVTLGPPLLMLIAYTINDNGPDGPVAFATTLGRVILSGVVVATLYTAISLAIASLTTRTAFATVGVIFVLMGSSIVVNVLIFGGDVNRTLFLADLLFLPIELVFRIYGEPSHASEGAVGVATGALVAAYLTWTTLFAGFAWWRYQRLEVTK
jgi:ABC-2 type transport system permease protein